jgi:hypothetical protein
MKRLFFALTALFFFTGCATLVGMSMRNPAPTPKLRLQPTERFAVLKREDFKDSERFLDSVAAKKSFRIVSFQNDTIGIPDFVKDMPVELSHFPKTDSVDYYIYPYNFEVRMAAMPSGALGFAYWDSYRGKIAVINIDSAMVSSVFEVRGFSRNWKMTFTKAGYLYADFGDTDILPDYNSARIDAVRDFISKVNAITTP